MNHTPTIIKQFGIWRSCTNYLRRVLLLNYTEEHLQLVPAHVMGHKHNATTLKKMRRWLEKRQAQFLELLLRFNEIRYVVTTRHPVSWVHGYFSYMHGHKKRRKRCPYSPHKPADYGKAVKELWNPKYHIWRDLIENNIDRAMYLQHEDLITNFPEPFVELAIRLDLPLNGKQLKNITRRIMSGGDDHPSKEFDPTYYTEHKYYNSIPSGGVESVIAGTDWEIAGYFGYSPND